MSGNDAGAVSRGTGWLAAAGLGVGLVNYVYALALTHLLNVEGYTTFAAGQSVLLVIGVVAASATPWVLAREIAEVADDPRHVRGQCDSPSCST